VRLRSQVQALPRRPPQPRRGLGGPAAPSGTIAPDGRWAAQCPRDGHPAVAIADIDNRPESIDIAVAQARPWRRLARAGAYDAHLVTDDRSDDRSAF